MNAFEKKLATFKDTRDAARMLLDMKEHGWNDQILASLSTVPIEEYVRALKSNEGKDLRRIIEPVCNLTAYQMLRIECVRFPDACEKPCRASEENQQ